MRRSSVTTLLLLALPSGCAEEDASVLPNLDASAIVAADGASSPEPRPAAARDASTPSESKVAEDPGRPAIMYGTKGDADLYVGSQKVGYLFFTVLAPREPDRAHWFARPSPTGNLGVDSYYLSLVLQRGAWAAGSFERALAGRASVVLEDGRSYSGAADELTISGEITAADCVNQFEPSCILHGSFTLTLPAETAGSPPLSLRGRLNN